MPPRLATLLAGSVMLGTGWAHAQTIKDPAELFPAQVLVYAELRQPGALAENLVGLFEGSKLKDLQPDYVNRTVVGKNPHGISVVDERWRFLQLFLAPELVRESRRLQGAALAITGIDPKGEPEYVALVLPGESNIPGFAMRAYVASQRVARAGEVEGVPLYYDAGRQIERNLEGTGPVMAQVSGVLVFGSANPVKEVLRRVKGRGTGPALAASEPFQEARRELGSRPGLFVYEEFGPLLERFAPMLTQGPNAVYGDLAKAALALLNPKAFQSVAAALTLEPDSLVYRAQVRLRHGQTSAVIDALPATPLPADLLQFVPSGALVVAGLANADGEKRFSRLMEQADKQVKENAGNDLVPSQFLEQFETRALGAKLGKDLLGRIAAVAFALSDPLASAAEPLEPAFVVILRATDEDAAQALVSDVMPRLMGMVLGQRGIKPTEEVVAGRKIYALGPPGQGRVYFGRHGKTLVLGPQQAMVRDALAAGEERKGNFVADKRVAAVLGKSDKPIAVVVSKPLPYTAGLRLWIEPRPSDDRGMQTLGDFRRLANEADPFVLTVRRQPDRLLIEARQGGLKPAVTRLADFLVEQALRSP